MWWQVLPPLAIMGGCVGVLYAGPGFATYICLGKPINRNMSECTHHEGLQKLGWKRDEYMTGKVWEDRGFEHLSDE